MLADLGRRHALTQEPHRLVYPRFLDTGDVGAELVAVAAALAGYRLAHQLAMEAEARAERDLDAARAELTHIGQGASTTNVAAPTRGRRTGRTSEGS